MRAATMVLPKVPLEPLGPGLSDEQIASAEIALGQKLPWAYRKILRETNGCYLDNAVFVQPKKPTGAGGYEVRHLMGVGHKSQIHDLVAYHKMFGDRAPEGAFTFARDSGGNSFVVFTSGPRRGEVAFRDHEAPFTLTPLASSMDEFLEHLVPEAPEKEAHGRSARKAARKIVPRRAKGAAKKSAAKRVPKRAPRKTAAKKIAAKKVAPKKGMPKKTTTTAARKTAAKKAAPKKTATKGARKTATTATRKTAANKTATNKRGA
jgi:hypothetical protein